MYQYRHNLIRHLAAYTLLTMPGMATLPLYAADEDIDIPYTDTYGYVYDPATGTYIKQDPPGPAVTSASNTNTNLSVTDSVSTTDPVPATNAEEPPSSDMLSVVMVLLLAGGAFAYFTTRRMKKAGQQRAD